MINSVENLKQRAKEAQTASETAERKRFEQALDDIVTEKLKSLADKDFLRVEFYLTKDGKQLRPKTETVSASKLTKKELEALLKERDTEIAELKNEIKAVKHLNQTLEKEYEQGGGKKDQ